MIKSIAKIDNPHPTRIIKNSAVFRNLNMRSTQKILKISFSVIQLYKAKIRSLDDQCIKSQQNLENTSNSKVSRRKKSVYKEL